MKDIKQIIKEIQFGDLDNSDLDQLIEAIKWRRSSLARHNVWTLKKGDRVSFTGRRGYTEGTVVDVKIKNVIVDTSMGRYRVPANMLSQVEKETA